MKPRCCVCGKEITDGFVSYNPAKPELNYGECWECLKKKEFKKLGWIDIDDFLTEEEKNNKKGFNDFYNEE